VPAATLRLDAVWDHSTSDLAALRAAIDAADHPALFVVDGAAMEAARYKPGPNFCWDFALRNSELSHRKLCGKLQ
jgi:hypothetical protein